MLLLAFQLQKLPICSIGSVLIGVRHKGAHDSPSRPQDYPIDANRIAFDYRLGYSSSSGTAVSAEGMFKTEVGIMIPP